MTKQTEIPGTEAPSVRTDELDARLYAYLDTYEAKRAAAIHAKDLESILLAELEAAGIPRYPYTDRAGDSRFFVTDKTPRAKTVKAPTAKQEGRKARKEKAAADSVEVRTVSRASVELELRHAVPAVPDDVDPFERTRRAMDGL